MASPEFDFPDPFGPVMAVNPDWNGMDTSPPNDLKFRTSILTNRIPNPHKAVFLTTLDGKPHSAVLSTLSINEGAAYRLGGLIVITVFFLPRFNSVGLLRRTMGTASGIEFDVVIVGSGIAGLFTALRCTQRGLSVLVVTKSRISSSSTNWAQGGIAAVLDVNDEDAIEAHVRDTIASGRGLCDEEVVRLSLIHI